MTAGGAAPPGDAAPHTVFLSYSRDDRARAMPVLKALEAPGCSVWWDGLLECGDAFAHTTEAALETADAVVVLWSARSVQSHWVRDEATRGRDRGCMVPVSIDGTMPPLGFRQIQYIDLTRWNGKAQAPEFAEVLRAITAAARAPRRALQFGAVRGAASTRRGALLLGGGAVLAVAGGLVAWQGGLLGGAARSNSVAVLPFKNLGGDPAQAYFSDGLAEELRTTLSQNDQLEVAAQTSSSNLREAGADLRTVAGKLRVAFILDGSVRHAGDMLRITAQLVEGATGFEKWSQSFDRKLTDVLAVQSEIATIVADALASSLLAPAGQRSERLGGTQNSRAFDAYLRGLALYRLAADETSDRGALAQFDAALKLDASYAAAHAARSRALTVIANSYAKGDQLKALYQQSIDAARKAIELVPDLAQGHAALGFVLFNGRLDAKAARAPYQKSFELGFGDADILSAYANFAARVGKFDDARKAIARAQRLDPLNPTVFRNAGLTEFAARNYDAAQAPLRTALSLNPKVAGVKVILGDIRLIKGDAAGARDFYSQETGSLMRLRGLAIADARLGQRDAAQTDLARMIVDYGDNCLYQQAQIFAQWGQPAEALDRLDKALAAGDAGLVQSRNDPMLDPVRRDARFIAIQQQLGFVDAIS
ncbi:MAG: TIR domain-containing protein [Sphingomonadales bacterium]|nr:TIR domain-containing protein [Sphingomonadales bacterium]